jgi:F-type H+-transporting ATPase subunit delta
MKPDEGVVARRYARAALLYCDARGGHDAFLSGLEKLEEAMRLVPVLGTMLSTPIVKKDRKQELLAAIAVQLELPAAVQRFAAILVARNRADYLPAIGRRFLALLDDQRNRARATVCTPVPLDEGMEKGITAALSLHFKKEVISSFVVDETLYGGVLARVGNTIIDSSIRGHLDRMRQRLAALTS